MVKRNEIILQPRFSKRKYFFDYHAYVLDSYGNRDLFSNGGGASFIEESIAKKKAVGEALERYCGSHVFKKITRSSFNKFKEEKADPRRFIYFKDSQYTKDFFYKKINLNQEIDWIRGYSLTENRKKFVPAFATYLGYNRSVNEKEVFTPTVSSGLALGENLDEAIMRGILELIERDSIMLTWLLRKPPHRLDLQTIKMPQLVSLRNKLLAEELNVEICLLDTGSCAISIIAIVYDPQKKVPYVNFGFSTGHTIQEVAFKALEEAVMMRNTAELLATDKETQINKLQSSEVKTFLDHVVFYLHPQNGGNWKFFFKNKRESLSNLEKRFDSNNNVTLEDIIKKLSNDNKEVIYVDLTNEEVSAMGYKVVRVLVPELQPLYENHNLKIINTKRLRESSKCGEKLNIDPHPYG